MGRFNDEFFGSYSAAYDKLVSMTIVNIDGIIRRICPKILRHGQEPDIVNAYLCPRGKAPPWCMSPWLTNDFRTEFRVEPVCLEAAERYPSYLVDSSLGELRLPHELRLCSESTWARQKLTPEDICDYLNDICESGERIEDFMDFYWGEILLKSDYANGTYIHSILPDYDQIVSSPTEILESYDVDWETGQICKVKGGSLSCADIVFDFLLKIRQDVINDDIETWGGRVQDLNLRLVADVEPEPACWSAHYEELKKLMDSLRKHCDPNDLPMAGIISTFARAPLEIHKMLEKDNIYFIRFTKRGEISDGVSPGQTRL